MQTTVSLCHAEAQQAIAAIQNELTRRGKATVIAVADAYGELIALLRMDGAPLPRTKHGQRHASASPRANWARPRAMPSTNSTWPTMATRVTLARRRRARANQWAGRGRGRLLPVQRKPTQPTGLVFVRRLAHGK